MRLTKATRNVLLKRHGTDKSDAELKPLLVHDLFSGAITAKQLSQLQSPTGKGGNVATTKPKTPGVQPGTKAGTLVTGARVKSASERFSLKKTPAVTKAGKPLTWGESANQLEHPSDYDKALVGSFMKLAMRRLGLSDRPLTELDKALIAESAEKKGAWVGRGTDGFDYGARDATIPSDMVKSILDDTISGGLYMNPVQFDDAVILYPLLHSEILPYVDMKEVTGRRIIAPTMGNLSLTWGVAPGTASQPFNTAGLIGAISTPVFNVSGFIEVSNDLLADSPVSIGETVIGLYGERLKAELDRVIVTGDGVTEPGGIVNCTGLAAVNSENGVGGPLTVSDAQSLIFSLPVQYRRRTEWASGYIMADAAYSRFRGVPVGPGDERRVFGQGMMGTDETQRYQLFEYPCRISANLPNGKIIFGALKRYRLYRRLGLEFVREGGGRQLALTNTSLLGIRARFGGTVIDPQGFAVMQDGQA